MNAPPKQPHGYQFATGVAERVLLALSRTPGKPDLPAAIEHWNETNALNLPRQEFQEFDGHLIGKTVIDFGCGGGWQSVAMVQAGAKRVLGVDTNPMCLNDARSLADRLGIPADRLAFVSTLSGGTDRFDLVISQNSFEHFPDPASTLRQIVSAMHVGGELFISFGPPWLAPYGSHMHFFTRVPWVNILFPEEAVMRVRSRFRHDGARRYEDVESGLNKMTVARFERLVHESGLRCLWKRYRCVKGLNLLQALPRLRELAINHVSCVLRKETELPGA